MATNNAYFIEDGHFLSHGAPSVVATFGGSAN
jgi:hypothetical protein